MKTKNHFAKITVDDLKVTAVYDDESEVELENTAYTTNVDKLNTTMAGTKQLKITYEEKGVKKIATIIIVVKTKAPTQPTTPTTPAQSTAPTQTATPVIHGNISGLKVKALGKRKVLVKWGKTKNAFAYLIQVSTKKNFKKAKNLTAGETKYTLKNLKKGKTYYIRVRAASFDKQWSAWSKVKKIKVK